MRNWLPVTILIGTSDLVISEGRFILFEHVNDSEWIKFCTMMEAERMRQRGMPDKDMVGGCWGRYEKFWSVQRERTDLEQMEDKN